MREWQKYLLALLAGALIAWAGQRYAPLLAKPRPMPTPRPSYSFEGWWTNGPGNPLKQPVPKRAGR
jgi:hypothetical protein